MTDASNEAMLARRAAAVPAGLAQAMPIFVGRAVNGELWDIAGKRYIDFAGGIGTLNTGHCHPAITAAASRQLAAFTHVAAQVAGYPAYIELAERLNALAPVEGPAKTILLTTGAEAVENAVKIARAASGRPAVIAFDGAFHGRTFFTLGLTGKVVPYKAGFGPLPPHIHHIPFPDEARGLDAAQSLAAIDRLFYAETPPDQVAAIIIEPVQGEGGFNVAPRDLIAGLRALCDRHGILLIADEVQSGFGRTGRMFALDHYDVRADIVVMAKSLAAGLPLSAVTGRAAIMDAPPPGGLGGTYGGNPVACAAALAVLELFEADDLLGRAVALGDLARARLDQMSRTPELPRIRRVRGLGAMLACDIEDDAGAPAPALARDVQRLALENGLILLTCGPAGNAFRMLMPLTAELSTVGEGFDKLKHVLSRIV